MGASSSNSSRDNADGVLVGALRGRRMDLPGGGELCMSANAGVQKAKFMVDGGSDPLYLFLIGVCGVCDCERRFVVYRGKDGKIYGREGRDGGLHVLAETLREMLCKVGVTNRDLRVLSGYFVEKEYRSPLKDRSRFSDSILGRKRGVSVDSDRCRAVTSTARHGDAGPAAAGPAGRRPSSSLLSRSASIRGQPDSRRGFGDPCSMGSAATTTKSAPIRPPDDFQTVANRSRSHPLGSSRVRFGSATVYGSDSERESCNDRKASRRREESREQGLIRHPSGPRGGRGRKLPTHEEVDELSLESVNTGSAETPSTRRGHPNGEEKTIPSVTRGNTQPPKMKTNSRTQRDAKDRYDSQTPHYPQSIARDGGAVIGVKGQRGHLILSPQLNSSGGRLSSIDYGSDCDSYEDDDYEEHDEVMF